MRTAPLALPLLLAACNGVMPDGDGRYVSRAVASSSTDNPFHRAQQQAEAFCKQRNQPLVVEQTTGSTHPPPAESAVYFRCGYRPIAQADVAPEPPPVPAALPPDPQVGEVTPTIDPPPAPAVEPPSILPAPTTIVDAPAIVVSFASPGTGIDPAAEAALRTMLAELASELGHALPRRDRHWGREGEYDACIGLEELGEARSRAFVNELRERLHGSQFTRLSVVAGCGPMPGWETQQPIQR